VEVVEEDSNKTVQTVALVVEVVQTMEVVQPLVVLL
tara:strand:+ start:17 stop:124 length:108 start_codon:yes stop_codon:yes gene_type:complete